MHDDWISFWRIREGVDGYIRGLMGWAEDGVRRVALKAIGSTYLGVDRDWVEKCAGTRTWVELQEKDGVGWELSEDGKWVTIRRIKARGK